MSLQDNFAQITQPAEHFLLQVTADKDRSLASLSNWIKTHKTTLLEKIDKHGGIFFKGFDIQTAQDFEDISKLIDSNLCDKHPFNGNARHWLTKHTYEVASPSIKKSNTPRALHNEDSFTAITPATIMFCSLEPATSGGETLLADCRKTYQHLPEKLKKKFTNKYIQSKLVIKDDVFLVNSRIPKNNNAIIKTGKEYGAEDVIRLSENTSQFTFQMPAVVGSKDNQPVWFNLLHLPITFGCQLYVDTWLTYSKRKGLFNKLKASALILTALIRDLHYFTKTRLKKINIDEYRLADGEKITLWERIQINLAIWKSTTVVPLKKGDCVVLDNRLVAHGRMPYSGKRVLISCMGSPSRAIQYKKIS